LLVAGFALGLATLTRLIGLYLAPLLVLWLAGDALIRRQPMRFSVRNAGIFLLAFALISGAWSYRNFVVSGSWRLSQIEGIDLLFFRAADVVATVEGVSLEDARRRLAGGLDYHDLRRAARLDPELHLGDAWHRQAMLVITENPFTYLRRAARHSVFMMFGPGDGWLTRLLFAPRGHLGPFGDLRRLTFTDWMNKWIITRTGEGLHFLYSASYLVLLYILTAASASFLWRAEANRGVAALILVVLVYFVTVSAGPEAYYRFRVPITPFLCLLGGVGLTVLLRGRLTRGDIPPGAEAVDLTKKPRAS
jgi:hypothetical protein